MSTTTKFQQDISGNSVTTLLSTGLNSLANNALALSAVFAPSNKQRRVRLEFYTPGFGSAPTAGTTPTTWILPTLDGTNYADGSSSITPNQLPVLWRNSFRAVTTAQRLIADVYLPAGSCEFLVKNDGTGQALASANNTLKAIEIDDQAVT